MKEYIYCPMCRAVLVDGGCACGYHNYDNPIPVVVSLIPMDNGIVCVQRKNPPFVGGWCLPGGYMNKHGLPKAEACREVLEETGLIVRIEQILCVCNPMPGEVNQTIVSYLARPVGGELKAGDDAADVAVFTKDTMPESCFRSHRMLINNWFDGVYGTITGKDLEW